MDSRQTRHTVRRSNSKAVRDRDPSLIPFSGIENALGGKGAAQAFLGRWLR